MNIYIFENQYALDLEPITLTRPSFEIRCGAFTCIERIHLLFPESTFHLIVRPELEELTRETFPGISVNPTQASDGIWILGNVLWARVHIEEIMKNKQKLFYKDLQFVGGYLTSHESKDWLASGGPTVKDLPVEREKKTLDCFHIRFLWEAVSHTGTQLSIDSPFFKNYSRIETESILINESDIWVHPSAVIFPGSVIDASLGPVILDKNVIIKPMAYLEGPLYLGEGNVVEPMTKFKGANSIGPGCKLGGEINQVIIQGRTNKVHDGHLGDAYLGEWVNLGAGTTNSNLKNNYSNVSVMVNGTLRDTGSKHIGCFLGDHVKTAIRTIINTGTVIGTGSNIATKGFPPKTISPFSWCVGEKIRKMKWEAFLKTLIVVKSRRELKVSNGESVLLLSIYKGRSYGNKAIDGSKSLV